MSYKTKRISPQGMNKDKLPDESEFYDMENYLPRDTMTDGIKQDERHNALLTGSALNGGFTRMVAGNINDGVTYVHSDLAPSSIFAYTLADAVLTNVTPAVPKVFQSDASLSRALLNNNVILNVASIGEPIYTTGKAVFQPLPGWFAPTDGANFVRQFRDFLFAGGVHPSASGIGTNGDQVSWSNRAIPGVGGGMPTTWAPTATNEAGDLTLQGPGYVVDAVPLGDNLIVYKQTSAHAIREVGLANGVFGARQVSESIGIPAMNCVREIRGLHYVVTNDDIVTFDGRQARSIIDGKLRRWLFNQLAPTQLEQIFTAWDPNNNEFLVMVPDPEAALPNVFPTLALVFNGTSWSKRRIGNAPNLAGTAQQAVGDGVTSIDIASTDVNAPEAPSLVYTYLDTVGGIQDAFRVRRLESEPTLYAEKTITIAGIELEPGARSMLTRVRPLMENPGVFDIEVGVQTTRDPATITWSETGQWSPALANDGVTFSTEGRFHAIRITEGATVALDRFVAFDVDYEPRSRF